MAVIYSVAAHVYRYIPACFLVDGPVRMLLGNGNVAVSLRYGKFSLDSISLVKKKRNSPEQAWPCSFPVAYMLVIGVLDCKGRWSSKEDAIVMAKPHSRRTVLGEHACLHENVTRDYLDLSGDPLMSRVFFDFYLSDGWEVYAGNLALVFSKKAGNLGPASEAASQQIDSRGYMQIRGALLRLYLRAFAHYIPLWHIEHIDAPFQGRWLRLQLYPCRGASISLAQNESSKRNIQSSK
ncbi:hypothetical protein F5146DRAFT_997710 [Armillaria mellea]|nr:hypothetical protein F5146DRAFT_997710 [Armillaria mellea]